MGDPEAYLAGCAAIMAEYPPEVMNQISDPVTGTRLIKDYPSLSAIRKACDVAFEPIEREIERKRAMESYMRGLPEPRRERTPEEQDRIDRQVAEWRKSVGLSA